MHIGLMGGKLGFSQEGSFSIEEVRNHCVALALKLEIFLDLHITLAHFFQFLLVGGLGRGNEWRVISKLRDFLVSDLASQE